MDRLEAVRLALVELGDVSGEELTAFIRQRFSVEIDARFLPVFKATLLLRGSRPSSPEPAQPVT